MNRKVLFHVILTDLSIILCDGRWWKFHSGIEVRFSYEIDIGKVVYAVLSLDFGVSRQRQVNIFSKNLTFRIRIYIIQLIILVEEPDRYSGIEIFSTHQGFCPISVIVYDLYCCWKRCIVISIFCLILSKIVIQKTYGLNIVKVYCSTRYFCWIVWKIVTLNI
jgi:hypothetical protein